MCGSAGTGTGDLRIRAGRSGRSSSWPYRRGNTELAKSLATALFDTEENMVRIGYTDGELNVVDENQA